MASLCIIVTMASMEVREAVVSILKGGCVYPERQEYLLDTAMNAVTRSTA